MFKVYSLKFKVNGLLSDWVNEEEVSVYSDQSQKIVIEEL